LVYDILKKLETGEIHTCPSHLQIDDEMLKVILKQYLTVI